MINKVSQPQSTFFDDNAFEKHLMILTQLTIKVLFSLLCAREDDSVIYILISRSARELDKD